MLADATAAQAADARQGCAAPTPANAVDGVRGQTGPEAKPGPLRIPRAPAGGANVIYEITRRSAMAVLAAAPAALSQLARAQTRARRRPNFLFILADDHAGYIMGCDGNRAAVTPNIDRLAGQGARFSAHHCNSPVCTPSRQSFFTGQLPHAVGVTLLNTALAPDKPTLARQFRQAGYTTAVFGKMHFNRPAEPGLHGFDIAKTEDAITKDWQAGVKPRPAPSGVATKPPWHPFADPARIWLNSEKLPFPCFDSDMRGTYIANQAIDYLEQRSRAGNGGQPFALWTSIQEPHSPYDFPVEDRRRFDPARFTVPLVGSEDAWQIPLVFRDLTDGEKRGIIAAYYTSVAFMDRNVGRVLDALRRLRLEDDTFVIYMSDHGYNLGQHGRFEKHCGYEPSLRIPLIMRYPGKVRQAVITDLTEHIDVPATIVDVMGLPALPVQHGQSLRPYLEGRAVDKPRDHIFSEYLENEEGYIKTREWKYIFCSGKRGRLDGYQTDRPTPGRYWRLYNLKDDPGEFTDVAAAHPEIVDKCAALMLSRFRATHPERESEPAGLSRDEGIEFYLRPRDARPGRAAGGFG
jgi:arylsulfatase A-like enzyme